MKHSLQVLSYSVVVATSSFIHLSYQRQHNYYVTKDNVINILFLKTKIQFKKIVTYPMPQGSHTEEQQLTLLKPSS